MYESRIKYVPMNVGLSVPTAQASSYLESWVAAVVATGGTVSQTQRTRVGALISGLTTQAANLSSRINTYMTAWGVNTY